MRLVSLNAARMAAGQQTDDVAVVLIVIDHPDIVDGPLRISSDNKHRITASPLTYGTWSVYASDDGSVQPFYFIGMKVLLPDDEDEAEATASLVIDVLDADIVKILTSTTEPATCRMAVVLASTPDLVEYEVTGLQLASASGDWGTVALKFSMENLYDEPFPAARMSKERFPGLFR